MDRSIKKVKNLDELKELNEGDVVSLAFNPKIYLRIASNLMGN